MFPKVYRKKFCEGRAPLSDADFCSRLGVPADKHSLVAAAREALARFCRVPATLIYPEDPPATFPDMVWDWDEVGVVLELEAVLNIPLDGRLGDEVPPLFRWGELVLQFRKPYIYRRGPPGPSSIGEWTVQVADYLAVNSTSPCADC